jgi:hypothetical protein
VESGRGGSSTATTAESTRNGSHSIIEAAASLTSASVMSIGQSIASDATTGARGRKERFYPLLAVKAEAL